MPWHGINGFPYTPASVTWNAPPQSGVYLLYRPDGRPIYVGESGDLKARLLAHLISNNDDITREAPTHFGYELVPTPTERLARSRALILEVNPVCNMTSPPAPSAPGVGDARGGRHPLRCSFHAPFPLKREGIGGDDTVARPVAMLH